MGACDYLVTLDNVAISARFLSLRGQPQQPGPGDVMVAHSLPPMVLGTATDIRLRSTEREIGLVLLDSEVGESHPTMACRVRHAWIKPRNGSASEEDSGGEEADEDAATEKVLVNPLEALSASEVASLRGIRLEAWDSHLETHLRNIDCAHCAVSIDNEVLRAFGGGLPPLPQELQYLFLDFTSWSSNDRFDLSALARFRELRVLVLPSAVSTIDIGFLADAKRMRVFHASGVKISGLEQLSALHELRDLNFRGCDCVDDRNSRPIGSLTRLCRLNLARCRELTSLEFTRSLNVLEFIDVSETNVTDLTVLGERPALREVVAIKTPVSALPSGQLPSLVALNVMSSGVAPAAVADFRQLHRNAQVLHGWADALRGDLAQSDHVLVRSGGTCHRNPEQEKTLLEESDAGAVEELALAFEIDEASSGGHCMCCGDPTVEFRRRGELLAEVGLHHGRSARWKGWPGDAVLSLRGRDQLAAWLSKRGVRSFSEAHQESRLLETSEEALVEECLRVLPPRSAEFWRTGRRQEGSTGAMGVASLFGKGPSVVSVRGPSVVGTDGETEWHRIAAVIEEELGDPIKVAVVGFRLMGCGEGSWNHVPRGGLHQAALELLEKAEPPARGSALELVATDPTGWEGAVRWLLYHDGLDGVPENLLSEFIGDAFRHALSHPRGFNRRHALALLGTGKGPFVVAMLREVLNGLAVRKGDLRHANEPGGWVVSRGGPSAVPDGASDTAFAALLLARLGDRESYMTVCELASKATGPSRNVLLEARAVLESRPWRRG